MLTKFRLFSEWQEVSLYGETLIDAVARVKTLKRPDKYAAGVMSEEGEIVKVARVVGERSEVKYTRGDKKIKTVIFETEDGRYLDVDAYVEG